MILSFNTIAFSPLPIWGNSYTLLECARLISDLGYSGIEIIAGRPHAWPYDLRESGTGGHAEGISRHGVEDHRGMSPDRPIPQPGQPLRGGVQRSSGIHDSMRRARGGTGEPLRDLPRGMGRSRHFRSLKPGRGPARPFTEPPSTGKTSE